MHHGKGAGGKGDMEGLSSTLEVRVHGVFVCLKGCESLGLEGN